MASTAKLPTPTQHLLLAEFETEAPSADEYPEWCEAKAHKHGVPQKQVKKFMDLQNRLMGSRVRAVVEHEQAKRVAKFIGLNYTKAMTALGDAMTAEREHSRCDRQGKLVEKWYEADHKIRLSAAVEFFKLMGANAPQRLDVEVGLTDELMDLEQGKVMMRFAELLGQAAQDNPEVKTRFESAQRQLPEAEIICEDESSSVQ